MLTDQFTLLRIHTVEQHCTTNGVEQPNLGTPRIGLHRTAAHFKESLSEGFHNNKEHKHQMYWARTFLYCSATGALDWAASIHGTSYLLNTRDPHNYDSQYAALG